jgi:hypothetical protein
MPRHTLRKSLLAALAVGVLPLLAACGGSGDTAAGSAAAANGAAKPVGGAGQLAVPDGTDDETKKSYLMENAIAACMKKQGFSYTPHVATPPAAPSGSVDGEDYALAKKSREKYGFGFYAAAVYPDDPKAGGKFGGKTPFPADDDQTGLTPAQLKAYDVALTGPPAKSKAEEKPGGCDNEGRILAYGPPLSAAAEEKAEDARKEKNRADGLALNGDTQLVQLAQEYAACLTAQGIPVSTTQPTGMATMVRLDIGKALPEHHTLTREAALPRLTQDISVALKDLECGKEFRAAYFPKEKASPYYGDGA